uniref:Uncharacterized protein n=1 Tax=Anguilla anguilla TaxID=7936 RepID=A0A0E9UED2_ANGAN
MGEGAEETAEHRKISEGVDRKEATGEGKRRQIGEKATEAELRNLTAFSVL